MQKMISLFILAIVLSACSSDVERNVKWSEVGLQGKKLTLIDETRVEVLSFGEAGIALGTFGTKNGGVIAPVVFWRVEDDLLKISDEKGSPARETYALRTIQENVLEVETKNGAIEKFVLSMDK